MAERRDEDYQVYQPAEDSALIAGTAAEDLAGTTPGYLLDVGTGSGYVGARLADTSGARVVGVDLNPTACLAARDRGLEVVVGNLVDPFRDAVFDVVVFNPPYLPASDDAQWDDWFEVAITGGETGRELVERFIDAVGRVLTPGGVVYLLVSTLTGVDGVVQHAGANEFSAAALADASYPGETLTVLKLVR